MFCFRKGDVESKVVKRSHVQTLYDVDFLRVWPPDGREWQIQEFSL